MKTFYSLLVLMLVVLSACGPGGELQELRTQVETLQGELTEAQTALEESQTRVAELEATGASVAELESALDEAESAIDEALEETEDNAEVDADAEDIDEDVDADADADDVETADDVVEDLTSTEDETDVEDINEDTEADDIEVDVDESENIEAEESEETDNLEDAEDADAVEAENADDAEAEDVDDEAEADETDNEDVEVEADESADTEAEDTDETDEAADVEDVENSEDTEDVDDTEDLDEDTEEASETPEDDAEDNEEDSDGDDATTAGAAGAVGAGAAALVASLPDDAEAGGSVTIAITAEPPGWDPSVSTSQEIARVMYHNVFEGLVRFDESGKIVPALAESWELSDDALTWTFELRENVKFHDGSDLTPEDVIAKFERAIDEASGHTNPQYYAAIESIEADGNTITFNLSEASSSLLYNLARPDSIIYPAALADTQRSEPVGTGPFSFAEYTEGSEVRLERFEDYYLDGVPFLDEVVFRIVPDENARFAALQSGDIDLIGTSLAPEQFEQSQDIEGVVASQGDATTEITLAMNNAREPFDDPLVRQAITHAIDKNAIVEGAMFGLGTVIGSHVTPSEGYYTELEPYPYDPERARELLAEAGYEDSLEITFELPPYNIERRAGEVIAQQLSEVGIEVDLSVVEWSTWLERIFIGKDYGMTIIGHSEPRDINVYGDPDYYYGYAGTEAIAEVLGQIEQTADIEEQNQFFVQIAETIAEDAVNVWVFAPPYLVAAREDIGGYWTNQPTPSIDATQMYRTEN